jgi:hypothetical protein
MQLSLSCSFLHESAVSRLAAQVSLQFYLELACYANLEDTYLIANYFLKKILIVVDDSHYTCTSWRARPFHDVTCSQSAGANNIGALLFPCPPLPPPQRMLSLFEFRSKYSEDSIPLFSPSLK